MPLASNFGTVIEMQMLPLPLHTLCIKCAETRYKDTSANYDILSTVVYLNFSWEAKLRMLVVYCESENENEMMLPLVPAL